MTHTAELLPCAHCGCEDVAIIPAAVPNGRIRFRPQCGDDGCRASLALYGTEAEAITAWNTRAGIPDPAQLRADRDALLEVGQSLLASLDPDALNPEQFNAWCALNVRIRGEGE